MIRAAVRPKAKFCTYWLKGRTRKMLSTKRVRNGQSTLRYVTKALVPGTYRVTVYCGVRKGSARLKVGDTTLLPPRCHQSFPDVKSATAATAAATRVPGGDLQCCGGGGRYRPTDRVAAAGIRLSTPRREGRDMDRGDSQLLVR